MTRATWERHANIGGPASTLLAIHDQFRIGAERLSHIIEREPPEEHAWVRRAFRPLAQTLHHHHHAEEAMLFPLVHRRTGAPPAQLVIDHEALTEAIAAVEHALEKTDRANAKAAIKRFREVLVEHLDREEKLVIPVLLEVTPQEAWAMLHG